MKMVVVAVVVVVVVVVVVIVVVVAAVIVVVFVAVVFVVVVAVTVVVVVVVVVVVIVRHMSLPDMLHETHTEVHEFPTEATEVGMFYSRMCTLCVSHQMIFFCERILTMRTRIP